MRTQVAFWQDCLVSHILSKQGLSLGNISCMCNCKFPNMWTLHVPLLYRL
jgi:hypothetical protein